MPRTVTGTIVSQDLWDSWNVTQGQKHTICSARLYKSYHKLINFPWQWSNCNIIHWHIFYAGTVHHQKIHVILEQMSIIPTYPTWYKLHGWINCCLGTLDWPSWPPHTEHRVKKLVILKEVVCNQSKMKLNDMVSKIGQYKTISNGVDTAWPNTS